MSICSSERGIAVISVLGVSAVLAVLAVLCLTLVGAQQHAQAREQRSFQARWNARAGYEHYLAEGQLPAADAQGVREWALDPQDPTQRCRVTSQAGRLTFEGVSGSVSRTLTLVGGDPSRPTEEP